MFNRDQLKDFVVVTGHYGCGKTNFAINLALAGAAEGRKVTVADFDLVNPYFRTSDYRELLESRGIRVVAPVFGHTNLDIPSLPAEMYSIFDSADVVIADVGGDDVGSTVLGRFRHQFETVDYDMLYVVNRFRNFGDDTSDTVEVLREIEAVSTLKATAIVNNSHMMKETDFTLLKQGAEFAARTAEVTGLKLLYTTVERKLFEADREEAAKLARFGGEIMPVDIFVNTGW